VRRILCLTESCIVERDPSSYSICSLKPLVDVRHTSSSSSSSCFNIEQNLSNRFRLFIEDIRNYKR
jgi:hypothetical protein